MESTLRRTWAEIDLDALAHNYETLRRRIGAGVKFLGVVKADAYGHGAVRVAQTLQELGADYLAVSSADEAMELRENGITMPVLILGHTPKEEVPLLIEHHITQAVTCQAKALEYSQEAVRCGGTLKVHIKVDTGMSRLGFLTAGEHFGTGVEAICAACRLPGLEVEGIFTHFAVADVPSGEEYTEMQYDRFRGVCEGLAENGLDLPLRHCANSGAIQSYRKMHCTMTRAGIILYGYRPDASVPPVLDLKPAMTVKARVVQVRDIPAHTTISYGRTFETGEPTHMAVVSVGYADGFLRTGSGKAHVVLDGRLAPVMGRICMDMCMVRIPEGAQVHRGDEVTVFGPGAWTAEDAAEAAGTISYEVLCAVSRRVPRYCIG